MVQGLGPTRVVIVDDDSDDIFLTKIICKKATPPIDVIGLSSGKALYDHIKFNGIGSIDVILLDINMPIENGYEILKKLNTYPNIEDVRVYMFSTSRRPHEKELALELGASGFIEKPSKISHSKTLIQHLTQGSMSDADPVLEAAE